MLSLDGAGWLNSEPRGPVELHGLVNFWTLTWINWPRREPYVRAWSHAYELPRVRPIRIHVTAPVKCVVI